MNVNQCWVSTSIQKWSRDGMAWHGLVPPCSCWHPQRSPNPPSASAAPWDEAHVDWANELTWSSRTNRKCWWRASEIVQTSKSLSSVDISRRLRPVRILLQKSTDDFDHVWWSLRRQSGRLMLHNLPHEGQPGICSGMRARRVLWRSSSHSCRLRPSGWFDASNGRWSEASSYKPDL